MRTVNPYYIMGKELMELKTGYFSLRQLKIATNNFDHQNKIGEGGFGPVYKGIMPDGDVIAVKQLSSNIYMSVLLKPPLKRPLKLFFSQARDAYYRGETLIVDNMFDIVKLKLKWYGSKSVVKYPRCSIGRKSTYVDVELMTTWTKQQGYPVVSFKVNNQNLEFAQSQFLSSGAQKGRPMDCSNNTMLWLYPRQYLYFLCIWLCQTFIYQSNVAVTHNLKLMHCTVNNIPLMGLFQI
ncbi:uncharacterized protein LOC131622704 isoform X2 [Vicia villosa]|uniref:uncharacterized protein LOC131622704 isoform X2 n=1 Tax=Vicia villosa TaxID=3911 RepID=UPI00273ABCD5|nr:uncharacterized protein LOC131622704 isoform X2 [Vicia villosa]